MDDKDKQLQGETAGKVVQMGATEVQMGTAGVQTAAEGDEKQGTVDDLPGFKVNDYSGNGEDEDAAEDEAGEIEDGPARITEAEARAMLIEDNARAKEDLKKASSRGKKVLVVVIALAVLLVVAGVATSIILGGMTDDAEKNKQEGNGGGNTAVVEKPEEKPEDELIRLSLDDEVAKGLRSDFRNYRGIKGFGWLDFYDEVRTGELSDATVLRQVILNSVGTIECVGEKSEDDWGEACYDGQEALEAAKRVFGRDVAVYDGFSTGKCAETYDAENGIFVGNYRCGGSGPYYLQHDFVTAEKQGDKLYLYEVVAIRNEYDEFGEEMGYYTLATDEERAENDGKVLGEKLDIDPELWLSVEADAENGIATGVESRPLADYAEQLSEFKWTFRRAEDGNYVFEGIERVR